MFGDFTQGMFNERLSQSMDFHRKSTNPEEISLDSLLMILDDDLFFTRSSPTSSPCCDSPASSSFLQLPPPSSAPAAPPRLIKLPSPRRQPRLMRQPSEISPEERRKRNESCKRSREKSKGSIKKRHIYEIIPYFLRPPPP